MFAPADRDAPPPSPDQLRRIPERLELADGVALAPRRFHVPRGERIDLQDCFEEARIGNTAWAFAELHSTNAQTLTIGMGADHWFTAWLNGEQVLSTPTYGNLKWPPSVTDFTTNVQLHAALQHDVQAMDAYHNAQRASSDRTGWVFVTSATRRAAILLRKGMYAAALAELEKPGPKLSGYWLVSVLHSRGNVLAAQGDVSEAEAVYREALTVNGIYPVQRTAIEAAIEQLTAG